MEKNSSHQPQKALVENLNIDIVLDVPSPSTNTMLNALAL